MGQNRFYIDQDLKTQSHIEITDEEHHHLKNVMRISVGEKVELVNGKGFLANAEVVSLEKKSSKLKITKTLFKEKKQKISLALGLTKIQKLDFTIEKCTELGVDNFFLFDSMNSEKKGLSSQQTKRLNALTISALKQCNRLYLPKISYVNDFKTLLDLPYKPYVCDFSSESKKLPLTCDVEKSLLIIGPEKGFHEKERLIYLEECVEIISLHQNTLRAETAAISAATLLAFISSY